MKKPRYVGTETLQAKCRFRRQAVIITDNSPAFISGNSKIAAITKPAIAFKIHRILDDLILLESFASGRCRRFTEAENQIGKVNNMASSKPKPFG